MPSNIDLSTTFFVVVKKFAWFQSFTGFFSCNFVRHMSELPAVLNSVWIFGCPTANFGSWLRGQPQSPSINHCALTISTWRSVGALKHTSLFSLPYRFDKLANQDLANLLFLIIPNDFRGVSLIWWNFWLMCLWLCLCVYGIVI